jgi:hypothetical protein
MTNQHPITPPFELIEEWVCMLEHRSDANVFTKAVQWGADQELEGCCMWITREKSVITAEELGIARRPKPPTLKEQALTALHSVATGANDTREQHQDLDTIRKALEALPND